MSQSKFKYLSSFDEVTWTIDVSQDRCFIARCNIPWSERYALKEWIDDCCGNTVYCWNGTSTPEAGALNWGSILAPHETRCYLIFTNKYDNDLFILKYMTQYQIMNFGCSIDKAWHDSRKNQ